MGKGSRLGASPCAKQAEAIPPPPALEAPPPEPDRSDAWSPLIRSSLVAGSGPTSRRELRSAWGEEPLHPRKISSRRLRLTQIAEERREQQRPNQS